MTKILYHIEDAEAEEALPLDFDPANVILSTEFVKVNRKGKETTVLSIWYWVVEET